jgi:hypothetical protein
LGVDQAFVSRLRHGRLGDVSVSCRPPLDAFINAPSLIFVESHPGHCAIPEYPRLKIVTGMLRQI